MFYKIDELRVNALKAGANPESVIPGIIAARVELPLAEIGEIRVIKKAVDSRKSNPEFVYRLLVDMPERAKGKYPIATPEEIASLEIADPELEDAKFALPPVVLGTGPAGIFGALALAIAGAKPIIVDKGPAVEQRCQDYLKFLQTRKLNTCSNLLIGEGGAGTFSDGKLFTGTKDINSRFIINEFIKAGADPSIAYIARPHIGSDVLRVVAANLRKRIEELGGQFLFNSEVVDLVVKDGKLHGVKLANNEVIQTNHFLMAPGLGGRNLVRSFACRGLASQLKPFQIGCRVEHPQEFIDVRQYHKSPRPMALEAAEYHLVSRANEKRDSISSFCMCPGGVIVNASAWEGHSATNGMSFKARDGFFANSCLISTFRADTFSSLDQAYQLIEILERRLFERGGSTYAFPAQDIVGFMNGRRILRNFRTSCDTGIIPARVDDLLPARLRFSLQAAIRHFDKLLPGFIKYGKVVGIESCVSSPLRVVRDENYEASVKGVFPAGEGTGEAGGIISAGCDGIRVAAAMLRKAAGK